MASDYADPEAAITLTDSTFHHRSAQRAGRHNRGYADVGITTTYGKRTHHGWCRTAYQSKRYETSWDTSR
jgi:hypothetical protein